MDKYGEGERFYHLLWFPEDYKDSNKGYGERIRWWWDYFWNRDTDWHNKPESERAWGIPHLHQEGIIYFPDNSQ